LPKLRKRKLPRRPRTSFIRDAGLVLPPRIDLPASVIEDRERRQAAEAAEHWRDPYAAFLRTMLGEPPPGRSALDQMRRERGRP
jgi:hypothetical protein